MWIKLVSHTIWILEKLFYFPKLKRIYHDFRPFDAVDLNLVDVGANRGQSIHLFKQTFPNSNIYAFEPIPKLFKSLEGFQDKRVFVFQCAVGKDNSMVSFYESRFQETSSLTLPDSNSKWNLLKSLLLGINPSKMYKRVEVEMCTLDKFFEDRPVNSIFLLKIDVEGAEYEVIQGAENLISKGRIRYIQVEQHENDMRPNYSKEIESFLSTRGYKKTYQIKHSFGNFFDVIYSRI